MNIVKYPNADAVDKTISEGEPLLALISFDGQIAIMSDIDEAMEHHILLMKAGYSDRDIDKYFRISSVPKKQTGHLSARRIIKISPTNAVE